MPTGSPEPEPSQEPQGKDPQAQEQVLPMILAPAQGPTVEQPAKLIRIASMIRELLQDVRQSTPDEAGRKRLRETYERAVTALKEGVSKDLQDELDTLVLPLNDPPSESEIRLAQAQLVGWLEGLFQGIQAALWTQHMQARAEIEEMRRRRGLPPGQGDGAPHGPGQYL
ncbi:MAG TPA: proteasome activator [Methylomirabilota bacterium]|nr:proteasome activator [Methylomirabilota bacterium]